MYYRLSALAFAAAVTLAGCDQLPSNSPEDSTEAASTTEEAAPVKLDLVKDGIYSMMDVTPMEYAFYRAEFARIKRSDIRSYPNEVLDEHFDDYKDYFQSQNAYPGPQIESDPGYLQLTSAVCSVFNMLLAERRPDQTDEYLESAKEFAEVARDAAINRYRADSDPTGLYLNPSEAYVFHVIAIDEIRDEFRNNDGEIEEIDAYCGAHKARLPEVAGNWWE